MRIGEAWKLQWADIDFVSNAIRVTPEKESNPRIFKGSNKLMAMLSALQGKSKSNRIFGKSLKTQSKLFSKQRRRTANKLQNLRMLGLAFTLFGISRLQWNITGRKTYST